jgi:hypothetical protein
MYYDTREFLELYKIPILPIKIQYNRPKYGYEIFLDQEKLKKKFSPKYDGTFDFIMNIKPGFKMKNLVSGKILEYERCLYRHGKKRCVNASCINHLCQYHFEMNNIQLLDLNGDSLDIILYDKLISLQRKIKHLDLDRDIKREDFDFIGPTEHIDIHGLWYENGTFYMKNYLPILRYVKDKYKYIYEFIPNNEKIYHNHNEYEIKDIYYDYDGDSSVFWRIKPGFKVRLLYKFHHVEKDCNGRLSLYFEKCKPQEIIA